MRKHFFRFFSATLHLLHLDSETGVNSLAEDEKRKAEAEAEAERKEAEEKKKAEDVERKVAETKKEDAEKEAEAMRDKFQTGNSLSFCHWSSECLDQTRLSSRLTLGSDRPHG